MPIQPQLQTPSSIRYELVGPLADYLAGVTDQWLLVAPDSNPAMLEMFRDRDRTPPRQMVPWAGEFAGKYLTSAVQLLRLTGEAKLRRYLRRFVAELIDLQAEDGYLGPWSRKDRLTNQASNARWQQTWDTWGHYHISLGLMLWHDATGDRRALECTVRIADLICRRYLGRKAGRPRLVETGSTEMNLAVVHSLALLYRKTGDPRHLRMAEQIVDEFAATSGKGPLAGDYLRTGLCQVPFYKTPKPRWESLHPIMGLSELYWITGNEDYRAAFEHHWWSIVKTDRHNNGGFTSGEKAQGNPYHQGAIETCCTVAWVAMGVEMLRLTGDSIVADEIELATINSIVGLHSHTGRWVTYNTPMDGVREASAHTIVFQAREGTPELNCCSVNGPRGLGMIGDWAVMSSRDRLALNYYGPGRITARLGRGLEVALTQTTEYPRRGRVEIAVTPSSSAEFTLMLRIPYWSAHTRVRVNGAPVRGASPGNYLELHRSWRRGDRILLDLDMSLHYWVGEKQCRGKSSIYRGPVLLTYDRRLNPFDPDRVPTLDARNLSSRLVANDDRWPTIVAVDLTDQRRRKVRLCDFASAGAAGTPYRSWLEVTNAEKTRFTRSNPLRSSRPS